MGPDDHQSRHYYRKALPTALWRRLLIRQQQRIYERFTHHFPPSPGLRVVDIGVNGDLAEPGHYLFESRYPHLESVVACGLEAPRRFETLFPRARYVQVARGSQLPFADNAFDVAFCSAVVEHVGSRERQRAFLREVLRVAPNAFVTTPNRWYPVELHTLVPLVHYLPAPAHRRAYRALGFDFFSREENLNLLGLRTLRSLLPPGRSYDIERHRFLGLTSNLLLVVRPSVVS